MMEDYTPVEYQHREDIQRRYGGTSPATGPKINNKKYKNKPTSTTSPIDTHT